MEWGTVAGIVTAFCGMVTAVGGAWVTVSVFLPNYRKTLETNKQTIEIHQIVNQQRTYMEQYQAVLLKALKDAGIPVPDDQSKIDTSGVI